MKKIIVFILLVTIMLTGCSGASKTNKVLVKLPTTKQSQSKVFIEKLDMNYSKIYYIDDTTMLKVLDESFRKTEVRTGIRESTFKLDIGLLADLAIQNEKKYTTEDAIAFDDSLKESIIDSKCAIFSDVKEGCDYYIYPRLLRTVVVSEGMLKRMMVEFQYVIMDKEGKEVVSKYPTIITSVYGFEKDKIHTKIVGRILSEINGIVGGESVDYSINDKDEDKTVIYPNFAFAVNKFYIQRKLTKDEGSTIHNYTFTINWYEFFKNKKL